MRLFRVVVLLCSICFNIFVFLFDLSEISGIFFFKGAFMNKKRFAVYCFYDSEGIAGEYVFYYLEALRKVADYVYVVANCRVEEKSLERLQKVADRVDQRDNCGFDAYAYRHALSQCGELLCDYDELVFSNNY